MSTIKLDEIEKEKETLMEKYEKDTNEYCNKQNDKAIIETTYNYNKHRLNYLLIVKAKLKYIKCQCTFLLCKKAFVVSVCF
jgi:hypothetical protein